MSILEALSCLCTPLCVEVEHPVMGNANSTPVLAGFSPLAAFLASLSCVSLRSLCKILVALALFCLVSPWAL